MVLNWASLLSLIRDNSDYAVGVIMPNPIPREWSGAGRWAAAAWTTRHNFRAIQGNQEANQAPDNGSGFPSEVWSCPKHVA